VKGTTHRLTGGVAWLAVAPSLHQSTLWQLAGGGVIAAVFAHGRLSPDVDQYIDRLHHRGVTHFWLWPLLVCIVGWGIERGAWVGGELVQPYLTLALLAVAVGWGSHLAGDFIFGKTGIPLWPRLIPRRRFHSHRSSHWHYAGLRWFHSGGKVERYLAFPALIVALGALVWP
jgi:hypothetical protein